MVPATGYTASIVPRSPLRTWSRRSLRNMMISSPAWNGTPSRRSVGPWRRPGGLAGAEHAVLVEYDHSPGVEAGMSTVQGEEQRVQRAGRHAGGGLQLRRGSGR